MGAGASVAARITKGQAMDICGATFSLSKWDALEKAEDGTISKEAFEKVVSEYNSANKATVATKKDESAYAKRVRAAFDACDQDNDEKLTEQELITIFGKESAKWYQEQMDGFGDSSQLVSFAEWEAYFAYMEQSGKAEEALAHVEGHVAAAAAAVVAAKPASALENGDLKKRVTAAFVACDTDNDGKLSMLELVAIFGEESAKWYHEQMDGFGDKSDAVSSSEWEAYFVYMQYSGKAEEAVAHVEAHVAAAAAQAAPAETPTA